MAFKWYRVLHQVPYPLGLILQNWKIKHYAFWIEIKSKTEFPFCSIFISISVIIVFSGLFERLNTWPSSKWKSSLSSYQESVNVTEAGHFFGSSRTGANESSWITTCGHGRHALGQLWKIIFAFKIFLVKIDFGNELPKRLNSWEPLHHWCTFVIPLWTIINES